VRADFAALEMGGAGHLGGPHRRVERARAQRSLGVDGAIALVAAADGLDCVDDLLVEVSARHVASLTDQLTPLPERWPGS